MVDPRQLTFRHIVPRAGDVCAGAHMAILRPNRRSRVQRARAGRSEGPGSGKRFTDSGSYSVYRKFQERAVKKIQRAIIAVAAAGGLAWAFRGQCADRVRPTRSAEHRHEGGQRRLPAPEPAGADGQQLPGQLPVPGTVPRGFREQGALPFTRRQSLRQRAQQLRLRHRRHQPALGGQLGRLRRTLPLSLQGPRPAGHPGPSGEPAPHPDPEVRLGGAQSSRLHAGYGQVCGRRLLRDRPARGQWIPGARLRRPLPQSARGAPRAERHAVDRPGLQHQRRLRLSCRRERVLHRDVLHRWHHGGPQGPDGQPALHSDLGCRPDQHGRRPGHPGALRRGLVRARHAHRPGRPTTTSPPGPRSASAPRPAGRWS